MTAKINILKGIPGIFIAEEVKAASIKFQDIFYVILIDFDHTWRNNIFMFVLKWNFASLGTKIRQKHFKIKAPPVRHFSSLINNALWKAVRRQAKFLVPPSEQVKGDIVTHITDVIF